MADPEKTKFERTYLKTLLKMADYKVALGNLTRKIIISKRVVY